jgi:hypothetical protein
VEGSSEMQIAIQDVMRGWGGSKIDLESVVKEICHIAKSYGIHQLSGDNYASQWVVQRFQAEGITYQRSDADRSAAYLEMEPLFAQGRIRILDHSTLIRELKILERRPRAGGKTLIDHPTSQHDDYANSLAISGLGCARPVGSLIEDGFFVSSGPRGTPDSDSDSGFGGFGGGSSPFAGIRNMKL